MKLFEIYKKSFATVVSNPAVTLFLVLFLIVSNILTSYMFTSRTKIVAFILSFCVFLLSLCFVAGWFYIVKDVAKNDSDENKNYFAIFLEGIGKNIIPIGIGSFIYTFILTLVLFLTGKVAYNLFGSLDFILKDLITITQDSNLLNEYLNKLTVDQKYTIYAWQLSFIFASMIFNFIMLFYFPAIVFDEKSNMFKKAFSALIKALCFLFKNFFGALFLYICIYFTYMFLGILKVLFGANVIVSILLLFFYIYFISGAIMLIFNYYGQKNNCTDRCDSIGENENIDKPCEEN